MSDKLGEPFGVRPLEPSDKAELELMYQEFEPKRAAQGLPPADAPSIRRWLDRTLALGRHFVVMVPPPSARAANGGAKFPAARIVGHVMLVPMEEGTVELANFLHQSVRDRGIGTLLNRFAVDVARREGLRRVWLSVEPGNRAAVRSYEKAGFRRIPGSLWAPEIEMEALLDPA